jgi:hypothetical protein
MNGGRMNKRGHTVHDGEAGFVLLEPLLSLTAAVLILAYAVLFFQGLIEQTQLIGTELMRSYRILHAARRLQDYLSRIEDAKWRMIARPQPSSPRKEKTPGRITRDEWFQAEISYSNEGSNRFLRIVGKKDGIVLMDGLQRREILKLELNSMELRQTGGSSAALRVTVADENGFYCRLSFPCGVSPGGLFL